MLYNEYGNQPKSFLPYAITQGASSKDYQTSWEQEQLSFFQNARRQAHTMDPFAEVVYDNSPLNRVYETSAPGTTWKMGNGHSTTFDYQVNQTSEVRLWNISHSSSPITTVNMSCVSTQFYLNGMLRKNVSINEHGNISIEFYDKSGRIIKRMIQDGEEEITAGEPGGGQTEGLPGATMTPTYATTYYVYDDFGRLAVVIPPKAYNIMANANSYNIDYLVTGGLNEDLVYKYVYDSKGRLIEKKIPGALPVYLIYNALDQVVLQQDG